MSGNSIGVIVTQYRNYFDTGYMVTDATIVDYLAPPYAATHAWNFQDCVMSEASGRPQYVALAYGIAAHEIADTVSHNNFVPMKIRTNFFRLPNIPEHLIAEGAIDGYLLKYHPEDYERAKTSLNTYYNDPEVQRILQKCVSINYNFDLKSRVDKLNNALQDPSGFFTTAFKLPGFYENLAFGNKLYGAISFMIGGLFIVLMIFVKNPIKFIAIPFTILALIIGYWFWVGVANIADIQDAQYWLQQTVITEKYYFTPQHWSERKSGDPTGYAAINQANQEVYKFWYIVGGIIVVVIGFVVFLKIKRR
jgi:hypothetical protein